MTIKLNLEVISEKNFNDAYQKLKEKFKTKLKALYKESFNEKGKLYFSFKTDL